MNPAIISNWNFGEQEHTYSKKDTILYALGLGWGEDPCDRTHLQFVYEEGLVAMPSMAVVLATPGFWMQNPSTGISWKHVLHGEQGFKVHRPLPTEGTVVGRTRVSGLVDKGKDKGAVLLTERDVFDKESGHLLCTLTSTAVLRADGGFGGNTGRLPPVHAVPERNPDITSDIMTRPNAALLYRLSGDYNPLHADPAVAHAAGFEKPILHGLCSFGLACRSLITSVCDGDPRLLRSMRARFSAPVYPGETITTDIWLNGSESISFRARVAQRNVVVINGGHATLAAE